MCLIGARRRPCSELMLSRTRTRSRTSASCITSRCHSTSERCCYGVTEAGGYAPVPRPSRPADCKVLPIRVGGPTGSSTHQLNQGDLRGRAQPQRRPPVARAPAHVQPHRLQPVQSRDEWLEQPHQQVEREVRSEERRVGKEGRGRRENAASKHGKNNEEETVSATRTI